MLRLMLWNVDWCCEMFTDVVKCCLMLRLSTDVLMLRLSTDVHWLLADCWLMLRNVDWCSLMLTVVHWLLADCCEMFTDVVKCWLLFTVVHCCSLIVGWLLFDAEIVDWCWDVHWLLTDVSRLPTNVDWCTDVVKCWLLFTDVDWWWGCSLMFTDVH